MASDQNVHLGWVLFCLLAILAGGAVLRLVQISSESLWLDEATSVLVSESNSAEFWSRMGRETNPPLHYVMLRCWISICGDSELAVRIPSAAFGVLSLLMIYLVGRRLFGDGVGLISALVMAASSLHISYSQEARGYSMMVFLGLASYYFFIRYLESGRARDMVAASLTNVFLLYTHVYGSFIVASEAIFSLYLRARLRARQARIGTPANGGLPPADEGLSMTALAKPNAVARLPWVVMFGLPFIAFLPWVLNVLRQLDVLRGMRAEPGLILGISWLRQPTFVDLPKTLAYYGGENEIRLMAYSFLMVLGLFELAKLSGSFRPRCPIDSLTGFRWALSLGARLDVVVLLLLWLGSSIVIPFTFSLLLFPIYAKHYTIAASPAFYILVARGTRNTALALGRLAGILVVCSLLISSSASLAKYYAEEQKEQWRELEGYVSQHLAADEVVVFNAPYVVVPFWYYHRHRGNSSYLKLAYTAEQVDQIVRNEPSVNGVWLVLSHQEFTDPQGQVKKYLDEAFSLQDKRSYVGIQLYHYRNVDRPSA